MLKFDLSSCLSALLLSITIVPMAEAQLNKISVFNLAHLARQGYFKEQNIPGHSIFCSSVTIDNIQAKDIVRAAIAKNRLSPKILDDRSYLDRLEMHLNLACTRN
jgi:hypothetical protein